MAWRRRSFPAKNEDPFAAHFHTIHTVVKKMMVWKWLAFLLLTLNATSAFVMPRGAVAVRGSATKLNAGGTDVLSVSARNLAVAGRVPWKKLLISKAQGRKIMTIMRAETHALDMVILFVLAVFPDIVGRFL